MHDPTHLNALDICEDTPTNYTFIYHESPNNSAYWYVYSLRNCENDDISYLYTNCYRCRLYLLINLPYDVRYLVWYARRPKVFEYV